MMGVTPFEGLIASGAATVKGDVSVLGTLAGLMVQFDPRFEIMPGSKAAVVMEARSDTLKVEMGKAIPE